MLSCFQWEDGSVQADLPMQRLSELFNINHFIVSQVNPHVVPFISSASSTHTLQQSFLTAPLAKLIDYLCSQLKSTALNFLHLNMMPIHPSVKYVLDQKYLGQCNHCVHTHRPVQRNERMDLVC
jgi:TAG lipase/steryl ester hydrolase/phospholipase A2/LPA acyltransferase